MIGTVSREGNKVCIEPEAVMSPVLLTIRGSRARWSRGRQATMEHIEDLATAESYDHMENGASITAHRFRLGYRDIRQTDTESGVNYVMRKALVPAGP